MQTCEEDVSAREAAAMVASQCAERAQAEAAAETAHVEEHHAIACELKEQANASLHNVRR